MSNLYRPIHQRSEECEDYSFWQSRFAFAFWLFFFFSMGALVFGQVRMSIMALLVSGFWMLTGSVATYRHMKWHIENDKGRHL